MESSGALLVDERTLVSLSIWALEPILSRIRYENTLSHHAYFPLAPFLNHLHPTKKSRQVSVYDDGPSCFVPRPCSPYLRRSRFVYASLVFVSSLVVRRRRLSQYPKSYLLACFPPLDISFVCLVHLCFVDPGYNTPFFLYRFVMSFSVSFRICLLATFSPRGFLPCSCTGELAA